MWSKQEPVKTKQILLEGNYITQLTQEAQKYLDKGYRVVFLHSTVVGSITNYIYLLEGVESIK